MFYRLWGAEEIIDNNTQRQRRASYFCWSILICCPIQTQMRNQPLWFSFLARSLGWLSGQSVIAGSCSGVSECQAFKCSLRPIFLWNGGSLFTVMSLSCCTAQAKKTLVCSLALLELWAHNSRLLSFLKLISQFAAICFYTFNPLIGHCIVVFCICSGKFCVTVVIYFAVHAVLMTIPSEGTWVVNNFGRNGSWS